MKSYTPLLILALGANAVAQDATIKIDTARVIDEIDPRIYGVFMEPIQLTRDGKSFHTLYGPIYDPESPLANEDGFRTDYIEAARELKINNMRWPGGNFVAGYDWRDGIGPKDERPQRFEFAWNTVESNQVGTDEWVKLNRAIGSENIVCINMGTGSIDDARFWVEYCNRPTGTYWADKRAEYGHLEPFNIKVWCLGNEVDGSPWILGHKSVEEYCKFAIEAAKAMRKTSPGIELVANGSSWYRDEENGMDWVNWNWEVINQLHPYAEYLSIHRYWEMEDDYYTYMGKWSQDIEEKLSIVSAQLETVATINKKAPMGIAFDEWAPLGRGHWSTMAVAQFFNAFLRHADSVKMANFTLFTSILDRDTDSGETFKSPKFHAFKMYSSRCYGNSLELLVDCETFDVDEHYKDIPFLDVTAVHAETTSELIVNVVNRHREATLATDIYIDSTKLAQTASVFLIQATAPENDLNANYTIDHADRYDPATDSIPIDGSMLSYAFPPHSITQIVIPLSK